MKNFQALLETTPCPNCQSLDFAKVVNIQSHTPKISGTFSVVRCSSCGLHYLNPRPTLESLAFFYELLQTKSSDEGSEFKEPSKNWLKQVWYRLNYSNPLLPLIDQGPILDVGCGQGDFIAELTHKGFEAHGLELDKSSCRICRKRGFQVIEGTIETVDLPIKFYNWIVLSHALEHFLDPVGVLRKISFSLSEDGKMAIAVPYVKSPMVKLFGRNWHGWDPPFHLTHFDRSTLSQVCEKAGLNIVDLKVEGHPEDFTRSLALRTGQRKRNLLLRAMLWPPFLVAQKVGHGSYLIAVAEKA